MSTSTQRGFGLCALLVLVGRSAAHTDGATWTPSAVMIGNPPANAMMPGRAGPQTRKRAAFEVLAVGRSARRSVLGNRNLAEVLQARTVRQSPRPPQGEPQQARRGVHLRAACPLPGEGRAAIERVIEEKPDVYLKMIAQIIPKEFHVRDNTLDHMSDEELTDFLATIRAAKERSKRELARLAAAGAAEATAR